ncbi:MAG TPA: hypothetical protein VI894_00285 [Candidatus Nanoarchaeia archaeon]|nr:hypothetical protein [Candidatus Nanoarchaeia archaeon]
MAVVEEKKMEERLYHETAGKKIQIAEEIREYITQAIQDAKKYDSVPAEGVLERIVDYKPNEQDAHYQKQEQQSEHYQAREEKETEDAKEREKGKAQSYEESVDQIIDMELKQQKGYFVDLSDVPIEHRERFKIQKEHIQIGKRQLLYAMKQGLRGY